jgi:hypothetical protein
MACLGFLLGLVSLDGFAHLMAGGRPAVRRACRAAGPWFAGFGLPARSGKAWRMLRNPRRTRGSSRPGGPGCCQGRPVLSRHPPT